MGAPEFLEIPNLRFTRLRPAGYAEASKLKVSGLRRRWNTRKLTTMNGLYDTPAKEDSSKYTDFEYTMAIFSQTLGHMWGALCS